MVGRTTGRKAGRFQHAQVSEQFSMDESDQGSMDYLMVTEVYSIITAKVPRDLLESQKKYAKNKYCKYNDFKNASKDKHILGKGFERRYCSIPIDV